MEDNLTKIIIGVLAIISAVIGGAIYSNTRKSKTVQKKIKIKGKKNKVVGGDDNS